MEFIVYGTPRPQGSKKGYVNKKTGAVILTEQAGESLKTWREDVKQAALTERGDNPPMEGPVMLEVTFYLPRPKSHFRTGKHAHVLRDDAPTFCGKRPDCDKLLRSTGDALTSAGAYVDDSQIAHQIVSKVYVGVDMDVPGAKIKVTPL